MRVIRLTVLAGALGLSARLLVPATHAAAALPAAGPPAPATRVVRIILQP